MGGGCLAGIIWYNVMHPFKNQNWTIFDILGFNIALRRFRPSGTNRRTHGFNNNISDSIHCRVFPWNHCIGLKFTFASWTHLLFLWFVQSSADRLYVQMYLQVSTSDICNCNFSPSLILSFQPAIQSLALSRKTPQLDSILFLFIIQPAPNEPHQPTNNCNSSNGNGIKCFFSFQLTTCIVLAS